MSYHGSKSVSKYYKQQTPKVYPPEPVKKSVTKAPEPVVVHVNVTLSEPAKPHHDNVLDPRICNSDDCSIPILTLNELPPANTVKEGSLIMITEANSENPDTSNSYFVVSNGSTYLGFSPNVVLS